MIHAITAVSSVLPPSPPCFWVYILTCLFSLHFVVVQHLLLAVMGSDDGGGSTEAADFLTYVTDTFPNLADHWIGYETESAFLDIINDEDYSLNEFTDLPAFSAGVVFTSGSPDWAYTVRRFWGEGEQGGGAECLGGIMCLVSDTCIFFTKFI